MRRIKDEYLIDFLKIASKLEYLNIKFCDEITSDVIKVAIEETKKRTNNIVLTIRTSYDTFDELDDTSPLLHLIL